MQRYTCLPMPCDTSNISRPQLQHGLVVIEHGLVVTVWLVMLLELEPLELELLEVLVLEVFPERAVQCSQPQSRPRYPSPDFGHACQRFS
jgi:hypothetical protein